jgi:hypothetical protein
MSRRVAIAIVFLLPAFAVVVADVLYPEQHQPRERIWLLAEYAAAPAVIGAVAGLLARRQAALLLLCSAGTAAPLLRFLLGARSAEAAFERLTLNGLWFALIWFPLAMAAVILSGPHAPLSDRATCFGRRLWRPGTAFLLIFVALTFAEKRGIPPTLREAEAAFAFCVLLLGIGLLLSDLVPARGQWAGLQWTWMIMVLVSAILTFMAGLEVDSAGSERESLRDTARSALDSKERRLRIAADYEKRGALTDADRRQIRAFVASDDEEHAQALSTLGATSSRLPIAWTMAMFSSASTVLFIALAIQAHRRRVYSKRGSPTMTMPEGTPSSIGGERQDSASPFPMNSPMENDAQP